MKPRQKIRALTLHQPHAYCVVHRNKRIENRDWAPPDWLIGEYLAIHAGKTVDVEAIERLETDPDSPCINTTMPDKDSYVTGAVVAVAKLVGVVTESDDPYFSGPYGWVLDDVVAIEPVPCRGYQKLWPLDDRTLAEVRRRFQAAREAQRRPKAPAAAPQASEASQRARAVVERAKAVLGTVEPTPEPAPPKKPPTVEVPKREAPAERSADLVEAERQMRLNRRGRGRSGGAFPPDQRARYARGSSTSRRAAESIQTTLNEKQARVYAHIVGCGTRGATTDEVEVALGMSHQTASARIFELREDLGYIFAPGDERPTRSRRMAMVHFAREFLPRNVQERLYEEEQRKSGGQQRMF